MGDLTTNFSREEFACKCGCGFDQIASDTVHICQAIRHHFDAPVTITSACRCPTHNAAVNGSEKSQHVVGTAADVVVSGVEAAEVYAFLEENSTVFGVGGLGSYRHFTHLDTRNRRARW